MIYDSTTDDMMKVYVSSIINDNKHVENTKSIYTSDDFIVIELAGNTRTIIGIVKWFFFQFF